MKTQFVFLTLLLAAASLAGCRTLSLNPAAKNITLSGMITTKDRPVSNFNGVNLLTIGTITITRGGAQSMVKGSDNLLPHVNTGLQDGILVIEMENVHVQSLKKDNLLAFEIILKNLSSLPDLGTVKLFGLETDSLELVMSGVGNIKIGELAANSIPVNVSGQGGINLAGNAGSVSVAISSVGDVMAAELKCRSAETQLSGVSTANVWVTRDLTGKINGAGGVRYYGEPGANTNSTGTGRFEALGNK